MAHAIESVARPPDLPTRNEATPAGCLSLIDLNDIEDAELDAPTFIIEPVLPRGYVSLLGGHGGSGKSLAALSWCAHVAAGRSWAGFKTEQARALYVTLEDPGELVRFRLRRIIEHFRLDADQVVSGLAVLDGSGVDAVLAMERAFDGIREVAITKTFDQVVAVAHACGLIVIDNASDAFGGDENSRRQVRRFMRALGEVARQNNAAVVLLAHVDKNAAKYGAVGQSYSGSTAWHNTARSRLALIQSERGLELVHEKSNLSKTAEPVQMEWTDAGVLIAVNADVAKIAAEQQSEHDVDAICELVRLATADDISVPAAMSGPATALHTLELLREFANHFDGKNGRRRAKDAIVACLRSQRLVKVEWRDHHRHTKWRLELPQNSENGAAETAAESARVNPPIPPYAQLPRAGERANAGIPDSGATAAELAQPAQRLCEHCHGQGCKRCDFFGRQSDDS